MVFKARTIENPKNLCASIHPAQEFFVLLCVKTSRTRITHAKFARALPVRRDGRPPGLPARALPPLRPQNSHGHYTRVVHTRALPVAARHPVRRDGRLSGLPARAAVPLPVAVRHRGAGGINKKASSRRRRLFVRRKNPNLFEIRLFVFVLVLFDGIEAGSGECHGELHHDR